MAALYRSYNNHAHAELQLPEDRDVQCWYMISPQLKLLSTKAGSSALSSELSPSMGIT